MKRFAVIDKQSGEIVDMFETSFQANHFAIALNWDTGNWFPKGDRYIVQEIDDSTHVPS